MPHSYLFGHLEAMGKIMAKLPSYIHPLGPSYLVLNERPELADQGFIILDSWPSISPILHSYNPDIIAQFTQTQTGLTKSINLKAESRPLTQNKDIVTLGGVEWKWWRAIFNPSFSLKNLMSLIPAFLGEIGAFVDRLRAAAKSGEVIQLKEYTTLVTMGVIGCAIL